MFKYWKFKLKLKVLMSILHRKKYLQPLSEFCSLKLQMQNSTLAKQAEQSSKWKLNSKLPRQVFRLFLKLNLQPVSLFRTVLQCTPAWNYITGCTTGTVHLVKAYRYFKTKTILCLRYKDNSIIKWQITK